jgi:hypothetical protein
MQWHDAFSLKFRFWKGCSILVNSLIVAEKVRCAINRHPEHSSFVTKGLDKFYGLFHCLELAAKGARLDLILSLTKPNDGSSVTKDQDDSRRRSSALFPRGIGMSPEPLP